MSKMKLLTGIANNLADSFTSVTNTEYLYEIKYLLKEGKIEIDLLSGKVVPKKLQTENAKKSFGRYRKWFFSEIKKAGIPGDEITGVRISFSFKRMDHKSRCESDVELKEGARVLLKGKTEWSSIEFSGVVRIKTKDREYTSRKVNSSFS